MSSKRRSSAVVLPGFSVENSAKMRKVVKFLKDPALSGETPTAVREMLAVGAAHAVQCVSEERQPAQSIVCSYVQECLGSMHAHQHKILEEEKVAKTQDEPQIHSLQSQLATADLAIEEAAAVEELRKLGLAEAQRVLTEAKRKAEAHDSETAPAVEKASLDELATGHSKFKEGPLKLLLDGTWEDEKEAKKVSKQVMDEIFRMDDMEEAFLVAMPGTLAKRNSERGSFDNMVLSTLQEKLTARSTVLAAKIADAEATLATHEVEVVKLAEVSDKCLKARDSAEAALREAEAQQVSKVEARSRIKDAIEERTKASMNRENIVVQCEYYIEMLAETATDFNSLVQRSAAAEAAALVANAAAAAAAVAAAAAPTAAVEEEHQPAAVSTSIE